MVIEIALGIVLAVLILRYFEVIVAFSTVALVLAIAIGIIVVIAVFAFDRPQDFFPALGFAAILAFVGYQDYKRENGKKDNEDTKSQE